MAVYHERTKGSSYLFEVLKSQGILKDFQFEKEADFLIDRMITYSNTWLYNSFIYEEEINESYVEGHAEKLMGMLYPYLSDEGKSQYKELFPALFK